VSVGIVPVSTIGVKRVPNTDARLGIEELQISEEIFFGDVVRMARNYERERRKKRSVGA